MAQAAIPNCKIQGSLVENETPKKAMHSSQIMYINLIHCFILPFLNIKAGYDSMDHCWPDLLIKCE